mmetsp:Transcript_5881/g.7119  ORF Transcript_5881/g.7119 Transcript_5881/m.7119 type:complete len:125 (+) Transcript_5881:371-745(+)
MVPTSLENFSCTKIAVDYTLQDGRMETIETRVTARERAIAVYEDKVAAGETAVLATLPRARTSFMTKYMRVALGNMPAHSVANLRAYCGQKLDTEDQSYCLRIPMTHVPAYMGTVSNLPSRLSI